MIVAADFPDEQYADFDAWAAAMASDDTEAPTSPLWHGGGQWLLYGLGLVLRGAGAREWPSGNPGRRARRRQPAPEQPRRPPQPPGRVCLDGDRRRRSAAGLGHAARERAPDDGDRRGRAAKPRAGRRDGRRAAGSADGPRKHDQRETACLPTSYHRGELKICRTENQQKRLEATPEMALRTHALPSRSRWRSRRRRGR